MSIEKTTEKNNSDSPKVKNGRRYLDFNPTSPSLPRLTREKLAVLSKEELIEMVLNLNARLTKATARLVTGPLTGPSTPPRLESDTDEDGIHYVRVPSTVRRSGKFVGVWRVQLQNKAKTLGLIIYDDVFVGRMAGGLIPDVDLTRFAPESLGVSRQHALLRPTENDLYMVDLDSTNGTFHNGVRVSAEVPVRLNDGDTISFGRVHFKIKFLTQPFSPGANNDKDERTEALKRPENLKKDGKDDKADEVVKDQKVENKTDAK
ncbi:MAG: FHA domain-containing protein [Chloroflexota bacterium]